jgi:hypothetical protein
VSWISSVRVQDMQQLGYFGSGVGRVPGAEEVPEPEGELVVFEAFFAAGLRLSAHRFVAEVLQKFEVQVHQLTPNAMMALAKYVWATTSYGGPPSVGVFAKHCCLHWKKRKIGHEIAQFGSCTFTPRTGKTSMEVVELVPCARNKWGNWWDFWFYVSEGSVKDHPGLPVAVMCSHYYVAYPQFEVAEDDEDEGALRCAARMSSGRDLVEEFIGYGVWPLAHGWALGEVCPREIPSRAGSGCEVLPSRWICATKIPPRSCVKRKTVRRGSWALRAEDRGSVELGYPWVQRHIESGLRIEPLVIRWLSRGRRHRSPREETDGRDRGRAFAGGCPGH